MGIFSINLRSKKFSDSVRYTTWVVLRPRSKESIKVCSLRKKTIAALTEMEDSTKSLWEIIFSIDMRFFKNLIRVHLAK